MSTPKTLASVAAERQAISTTQEDRSSTFPAVEEGDEGPKPEVMSLSAYTSMRRQAAQQATRETLEQSGNLDISSGPVVLPSTYADQWDTPLAPTGHDAKHGRSKNRTRQPPGSPDAVPSNAKTVTKRGGRKLEKKLGTRLSAAHFDRRKSRWTTSVETEEDGTISLDFALRGMSRVGRVFQGQRQIMGPLDKASNIGFEWTLSPPSSPRRVTTSHGRPKRGAGGAPLQDAAEALSRLSSGANEEDEDEYDMHPRSIPMANPFATGQGLRCTSVNALVHHLKGGGGGLPVGVNARRRGRRRERSETPKIASIIQKLIDETTGKLVISPPEQKKKEKRTEPLRLPKIAGAGHAVAGFVRAFSSEKPHPGL